MDLASKTPFAVDVKCGGRGTQVFFLRIFHLNASCYSF